jgi:hypothetical protein
MDKESTIKIYETTDYGKFRKMLGNRDAKSESKIIASIQNVGALIDPILVNEKYEIIDGQNRLEALKQLGLPVLYIIQEGLDIRACRNLNIGQTNWSLDDYIYSYAENGNKSYRRLASLMMEFRKAFGLQGILSMAKPHEINEGGSLKQGTIKKGELELTQEEYELAVRRLASAMDLGYVAFCRRNKMTARTFWPCVSYMYQHQEVSVKEAIKAMEMYESLIPSCTKVSEQLKFIDDVLNRGKRKASSKVFLSTDFQKRRYIER